jgi:hypothetical protein
MNKLSTRIEQYNLINTYIKEFKKKDPSNCIKLYDDIYVVGENIILAKKIGSDSKYGLIFLSYLNKEKKTLFATKILNGSKKYNIIETNVLEILTQLNINKSLCPHFPITYGILKCNYNNYQHITLLKHLYNKQKLLFIFTELATDNLHNLMKNSKITSKILYNALTQIFISIMFFNKYIKAFHRDSHSGNFLYHKIKAGGYFHYRFNDKDYYVKNLGYLWIIWDFGQIVPFKQISYPSSEAFIYEKELPINYDYLKILDSFIRYNMKTDKIPDVDVMRELLYYYEYNFNTDKMPKLVNDVIDMLLKYTDNSLVRYIPSSARIINKEPFVL